MTAVVETPNAITTAARSLPAMVLERAEQTPTGVALRKKALGRWREYTWREYAHRASKIG